ncbi:uncharacterized protein LOC124541945 [Vanessa cardui]|uniref:uncharacterized protein LOC124541945 n=1 Tax=Vanessa cardui TaxID=171605 RepID=UPI001F135D3D|nr:uncharacterized protein LOC124541945 [Vanessa cardui]
MLLKLYLLNIFIIIVTCANQKNKGRLIIEINGKVIDGGTSLSHGNTINIIRFNITDYEYFENEKLRFTCKYEYVSGEYHRMLWIAENETIDDKCVGPYHTNDSLTVDWTPRPPSLLKCHVYAGNKDIISCAQKKQTFVAILNFFPKQNVKTGNAEKRNSILISGLTVSNILKTNSDSRVRYKYTDGDLLNLTCTSKHSSGSFYMKWSKDGVEIAKKNTTKDVPTQLEAVIPLNEDDDKSLIQCSVIENTDNPQKLSKNITIELVYESDDLGSIVTTEKANDTIDNATYNGQYEHLSGENKVIFLITFIVIAIVAIIIIIIIITVGIIKHYKKNKMKEDKVTLKGNSVETKWELQCLPDTYSNPADVLYNMNNATVVYSSPYKEVMYTTPIPKSLRVVNKIEYENLMIKNNDKSKYENDNNTYANINDKNTNHYSNTLCNGNISSDMYSYTVVDK